MFERSTAGVDYLALKASFARRCSEASFSGPMTVAVSSVIV